MVCPVAYECAVKIFNWATVAAVHLRFAVSAWAGVDCLIHTTPQLEYATIEITGLGLLCGLIWGWEIEARWCCDKGSSLGDGQRLSGVDLQRNYTSLICCCVLAVKNFSRLSGTAQLQLFRDLPVVSAVVCAVGMSCHIAFNLGNFSSEVSTAECNM